MSEELICSACGCSIGTSAHTYINERDVHLLHSACITALTNRVKELEAQLKRYDWVSVDDTLPIDESDVETITSFGDLIDDFYDENQEFAAGFEITHWRYRTPRPGES